MKLITLMRTLGSLFLVIIKPLFGTLAAERLVPSQYATIQAAVDAAASGDTIRIAAGDYMDQAMVLNKKLSIVGDPGAVLHAHPEMGPVPWNNNVAIFGFERADVIVSNLVLEGNLQADSFPGPFYGIAFRSSSGRVENCIIRGFRGTGNTGARGVNVNNVLSHGIINVSVRGCAFSDNAYSLLFFSDNVTAGVSKTRFLVQSNTFVGIAAGAPTEHVGLSISAGAEGSVIGNTFTDHINDEAELAAAGIVASDWGFQGGSFQPLQPALYSGNIFSNNSVHLNGFAINNSKITNNVFGATAAGSSHPGLALSGRNVLLSDNNFSDLPEAIRLYGDDDTFLGVPSGVAQNVVLNRNWFRNVTTPIRPGLSATFAEEDTQTSDFRPRFLFVQRQPGGAIQSTVRASHESLFIESSSDLRHWTLVATNIPTLPISQFNALAAPAGQQFFRLRKSL